MLTFIINFRAIHPNHKNNWGSCSPHHLTNEILIDAKNLLEAWSKWHELWFHIYCQWFHWWTQGQIQGIDCSWFEFTSFCILPNDFGDLDIIFVSVRLNQNGFQLHVIQNLSAFFLDQRFKFFIQIRWKVAIIWKDCSFLYMIGIIPKKVYFYQDWILYIQRVPALRAFWGLEKPCYMKFVLVGL